jgi:putative ABC transport system permease protein
MFRNYFVTAWRNLIRHKLHSAISIGGLGLGLACAILILLFVRDELSWDRWVPDADQLWRVEVTIHLPGQSDMVMAQAPMPLPPAMRDHLPEVRSVTRLVIEGMTLTRGDSQFSESVGAVDPNFLQVIRLPLLRGDPRTVLARPDSIVISEAVARKYFGDADPIGKTLTTGRGGCGQDAACANQLIPLRVTGVMRELPHNSQISVGILLPIGSLADRMDPDDRTNWLSTNGSFGYLTLAPGTDPARLLAKFKPVLDRSVDVARLTNVRIPGSVILEPRLTPFLKVHMTSDGYRGTMAAAGDWTTLYGLIVIGAMILLVAGFNFMNLATARATVRAREISLRKTVGARRAQLVVQFLGRRR